MLEKAITRKDGFGEVGQDTLSSVYEAGKFIGGNFVMPTWFRLRNFVPGSGTCGGDDVVRGFQIILGIQMYLVNMINLSRFVETPLDYLAVPSAAWVATNIASAGYELYKSARDKKR